MNSQLHGIGLALWPCWVMCASTGCSTGGTHFPSTNFGAIHAADGTLVIILPGIEGGDHPDVRSLRDAIDGQTDYSVQVWDWTALYPTGSRLKDLTDDSRNKARAAVLAERIAELRESSEDARLILIGLSGGARIAYYACASGNIQADELDRIILLSGAANRWQSVGRMTACAENGVFNYASGADEYLVFVPLAVGLNGYSPVPGGVKQLRWSSKMRSLGNDGKHLNCLDEPFCSKCVIPLLHSNTRDWPRECRQLGR